MDDHTTPFWPQRAARLSGLLYLVVIAGGGVAELFVRERFPVSGDVVPRAIGVALMIEGVAYWANSFVDFVAPGFSGAVLQILMVTGLAEVALCLWLLVMGVNVRRWQELRALADRGARTPS